MRQERLAAAQAGALRAALLGVATGDPRLPSLIDAVQLPLFASRVEWHGIAGLAHLQLREHAERHPDLIAALGAARRGALARHLATMADLRVVARALEGIGPWAVVKGPVLAEQAYGRPDLRQYGDLDLVVTRRRFGEAIERLEAAGAELLDRNWDLIRSTGRAEISLAIHQRTAVDLHWHLLNERDVREAFSWDVEAALDRAVDVDLDGLVVPTLDPADTLLHLGVHACLSGGNRLVWLKDLELAHRWRPVAASLVDQRATAAGLRAPYGVMADRVQRLLGAPLGAHPTLWSRLLHALGVDFRLEVGLLGDGATLARSTRRATPRSAFEVGKALATDRLPVLRNGLPSLDELRAERGGVDGRRAALADIAAGRT